MTNNAGGGGPPCVLVVDDDANIRRMMGLLLHGLGYKAVEADGGPAAVEALRARPGPVALALVDFHMPGGGGPEALRALRAIDPRLPCCFITGDPAPAAAALPGLGAAAVLPKPFTPSDLSAALA